MILQRRHAVISITQKSANLVMYLRKNLRFKRVSTLQGCIHSSSPEFLQQNQACSQGQRRCAVPGTLDCRLFVLLKSVCATGMKPFLRAKRQKQDVFNYGFNYVFKLFFNLFSINTPTKYQLHNTNLYLKGVTEHAASKILFCSISQAAQSFFISKNQYKLLG